MRQNGDYLPDILRLNRRIAALESQQAQQNVKIQALAKQQNLTTPSVDNQLRNSDFSFSIDAWNHTGAADDKESCYNWYLHSAPTAGQTLSTAAADVLKTASNSLYAADDPAWQRTRILSGIGMGEAGFAMIGNTKSLDTPLTRNNAYPSMIVFVGFSANNTQTDNIPRDGNGKSTLQFYAGVWDTTKQDWATGGPFTAPACAVIGAAGANSYTYQVFAQTDWGSKYNSNTTTIAGGQAPGSLNSTNYVKVDWTAGKIIGATVYDVYRQDVTGGTFAWVGRITNGSTVFLDQGQVLQTVGGFPAGGIATKAYASILQFDPPANAWTAYGLAIPVPATYDYSSLGAGKQWLRLGLSAACTGANPTRSIFVDKVFLSSNDGLWSPCPDDLSLPKQQPDIAPASSSQGSANIFSTGSGVVRIPPGGGTPRIFIV